MRHVFGPSGARLQVLAFVAILVTALGSAYGEARSADDGRRGTVVETSPVTGTAPGGIEYRLAFERPRDRRLDWCARLGLPATDIVIDGRAGRASCGQTPPTGELRGFFDLECRKGAVLIYGVAAPDVARIAYRTRGTRSAVPARRFALPRRTAPIGLGFLLVAAVDRRSSTDQISIVSDRRGGRTTRLEVPVADLCRDPRNRSNGFVSGVL